MTPKVQSRPSYDIAQRAQALTLYRCGVLFNIITDTTGMPKRQIYRYLNLAKSRGYDFDLSEVLRDEYYILQKPQKALRTFETCLASCMSNSSLSLQGR